MLGQGGRRSHRSAPRPSRAGAGGRRRPGTSPDHGEPPSLPSTDADPARRARRPRRDLHHLQRRGHRVDGHLRHRSRGPPPTRTRGWTGTGAPTPPSWPSTTRRPVTSSSEPGASRCSGSAPFRRSERSPPTPRPSRTRSTWPATPGGGGVGRALLEELIRLGRRTTASTPSSPGPRVEHGLDRAAPRLRVRAGRASSARWAASTAAGSTWSSCSGCSECSDLGELGRGPPASSQLSSPSAATARSSTTGRAGPAGPRGRRAKASATRQRIGVDQLLDERRRPPGRPMNGPSTDTAMIDVRHRPVATGASRIRPQVRYHGWTTGPSTTNRSSVIARRLAAPPMRSLTFKQVHPGRAGGREAEHPGRGEAPRSSRCASRACAGAHSSAKPMAVRRREPAADGARGLEVGHPPPPEPAHHREQREHGRSAMMAGRDAPAGSAGATGRRSPATPRRCRGRRAPPAP